MMRKQGFLCKNGQKSATIETLSVVFGWQIYLPISIPPVSTGGWKSSPEATGEA